jgi:hypothetical protein
VNKIFSHDDPQALLHATSQTDFNARVEELKDFLAGGEPAWESESNRSHLAHMYRLFLEIGRTVWGPAKALGMAYANWTTNHVESLNNMIKIDINR